MDSDSVSTIASGASSPSCLSFSHSQSSNFSYDTPETARSILIDHIAYEPIDVDDDAKYILVVGGLGYIGSHTVLELLKEEYNVIIIDDLSNSYNGVFTRLKLLNEEIAKAAGRDKPSSLQLFEVDYRSSSMSSILSRYSTFDGCQSRSRITGVIHFAAFKSVEESISKPIQYYQNNVCGMVDFLSRIQDFGIKNFVFSSSATIYGSAANQGSPLREEQCVHHPETYVDKDGHEQRVEQGVAGLTSPYGRTKWMCEAILADIAKSDPTWSITALRYFNPVGCHESGLLGELPRQKPSNLMPVIANVLKGRSSVLEIFGTDWDTPDGTAVRDFIHVVDLARGHLAALRAAADGKICHAFRTFNLGSGTGHTVREVVAAIGKASEQTIPVREAERRKGDVGFCVAQVDRSTTELGWKTEKSLDDCAADLWNFTSAMLRSSGGPDELPDMPTIPQLSTPATSPVVTKGEELPEVVVRSIVGVSDEIDSCSLQHAEEQITKVKAEKAVSMVASEVESLAENDVETLPISKEKNSAVVTVEPLPKVLVEMVN